MNDVKSGPTLPASQHQLLNLPQEEKRFGSKAGLLRSIQIRKHLHRFNHKRGDKIRTSVYMVSDRYGISLSESSDSC